MESKSNVVHVDFPKKKKKDTKEEKKLAFNDIDNLIKQADKAKW